MIVAFYTPQIFSMVVHTPQAVDLALDLEEGLAEDLLQVIYINKPVVSLGKSMRVSCFRFQCDLGGA